MSDPTDFNELLIQVDPAVRHLARRWSFDPEIVAEAHLSLCCHYSEGLRDVSQLLRLVDNDVRRYVRSEARQWSIKKRLRAHALTDPPEGEIEHLVDVIDARQQASLLEIPERARAWIDWKTGQSAIGISNAQRTYGRRWAKRARRALTSSDR